MCSNVMLSGDPERSHYTVLDCEYTFARWSALSGWLTSGPGGLFAALELWFADIVM